jgi:hypothetical protein
VRVGKGRAEVNSLDKEAVDAAELVNDEESSLGRESNSPRGGVANAVELLDDEGMNDAVELVGDEGVVDVVEFVGGESVKDSLVKESCEKTGLFMITMLFPLKNKMKL